MEAGLGKTKVSDSVHGISRRSILQTTLLGAASAALTPAFSNARASAATTPASPVKPFQFDEATISDLQSRLKSSNLSAHPLPPPSLPPLDRIARTDPHS